MITLTKDQLRALDPCNLGRRMALFGTAESLNVVTELEAGATISDILWVAGEMGLGIKCAEFAIKCAESVADRNADPRVQEAIDAAKKCLAEPSSAAAYDARAASYAAADAAAAYDADAAAYAAADAAADAAAYAARAAAAAYAAEEQKPWLVELFS